MEAEDVSAEQRITSELLAMLNEGRDVKAILDRTVSLLKGYLNCEAVGIRLVDRQGNIPYQAYEGFKDWFIAKESPLCIRRDNCTCIEITKGDYDPGLPFYTKYGSFHANELQSLGPIRAGMKTGKFRGECVRAGWESLALVPLRFCHKYYGLIQAVAKEKGRFPPSRVQYLENIAAQLALYIHGQETLAEKESEFSSLAHRIIHDLRNPLSSTRMFAELIEAEEGGKLTPQSVDFLHRISRNAEYMDRLIAGIASFAQTSVPAGSGKEAIDLSRFLRGLVKDMGLTDTPGLKVVVPEGLPTVMYPDVCLRRVLTNLISNAVKFSGQSESPTVEIGCQEKDTFYQISVTDNGIGIDEGELDRVFDPFYRTAAANNKPGSGLGLSIARRIVERNGGNIWVYSDKGKGSTFYFTVPK